MKKGAVIWLCGLAGSGKSTLATALAQILRAKFSNVVYLDGDELREFLGHFSYDKNGRIDMALKRAKMAKFLSNQGQIVIVSTISLFNEIYEYNRANLPNYFEVFIKCDFDELKKRDQKGLYTKALRGEMQNVVGVDIAYDSPAPHLTLENSKAVDLDKKAQFLCDEFLKFYDKSYQKGADNEECKNHARGGCRNFLAL